MEENKYKEALERAKKELQHCGSQDCDAAKQIFRLFPELAESEDEITRKDIISLLKFANHKGVYDKYIAWLEKLKDFDEQLEQAYKNSDEVQYKRGYDDGYIEGMAFAKQELEKQGEMPTTINVDKMVEEFEKARIEANSICQIIETDAYRKGVVDTLSKILIKEEKPITLGSKKAEGKLGEMLAASKEPAESGEDKELSHSQVTKKSDKDSRWKWDEDDEKFVRENILIGLGNIDSVSPELYNKIIDWINLIKKRLS